MRWKPQQIFGSKKGEKVKHGDKGSDVQAARHFYDWLVYQITKLNTALASQKFDDASVVNELRINKIWRAKKVNGYDFNKITDYLKLKWLSGSR